MSWLLALGAGWTVLAWCAAFVFGAAVRLAEAATPGRAHDLEVAGPGYRVHSPNCWCRQ